MELLLATYLLILASIHLGPVLTTVTQISGCRYSFLSFLPGFTYEFPVVTVSPERGVTLFLVVTVSPRQWLSSLVICPLLIYGFLFKASLSASSLLLMSILLKSWIVKLLQLCCKSQTALYSDWVKLTTLISFNIQSRIASTGLDNPQQSNSQPAQPWLYVQPPLHQYEPRLTLIPFRSSIFSSIVTTLSSSLRTSPSKHVPISSMKSWPNMASINTSLQRLSSPNLSVEISAG